MADIVIVGGENPVFIKEELQKIISSFPEEDRTVYYGDDLKIEDFFSDLISGSLFSARRLIVVRNADTAKQDFEKRLLSYFKNVSDTVCLVLEYHKIPAKVLTAASNLGNKTAVIHNFKKAWAQDQKRYAQRRLDDCRIVYPSSVLELLVVLAGEDIEELSGMLDRLTAYTGNDTNITEEHILFALERVKNASIFDLTDAVFQRNVSKALTAFSDLQHAGESFPAINAMFLRSIKIMWAVKTSRDGQIPKGFSVSPYEWKKYQGFASRVDLRFLSHCLETAAQIEFDSKTNPEIFAQSAFETFLAML